MEGVGNERLSDNQPKSSTDNSQSDKKKKAGKRRENLAKSKGDVGRALRSVYDTTLNEDVPPEFLDLLGKLD